MSDGGGNQPDWRSPAFREQVRAQIASAVQSLGSPPQAHSPAYMEDQMFKKSTNAAEYTGFVQKLMNMLRERGQQAMGNQGRSTVVFIYFRQP